MSCRRRDSPVNICAFLWQPSSCSNGKGIRPYCQKQQDNQGLHHRHRRVVKDLTCEGQTERFWRFFAASSLQHPPRTMAALRYALLSLLAITTCAFISPSQPIRPPTTNFVSLEAGAASKEEHVSIDYCTGCRWMLRAAWMAQELLTTFQEEVDSVTLIPSRPPDPGGVFVCIFALLFESHCSPARHRSLRRCFFERHVRL